MSVYPKKSLRVIGEVYTNEKGLRYMWNLNCLILIYL